ncbi:hypothetical protein [Pseudomonas syringae]|uniref:hypothetical protein n=1 Tax=Pseudomonas syringae TaxID=317 RepID=UPI0011AF1A18|nr:hypothetical protein [Pseudomonas syringae]
MFSVSLDTGINDKPSINPKKIASKIDEVISNKTEGFFLIDNVVDFQNNKTELGSYVALLGEPRPIHKRAALGISEGLSHDDFNPLGMLRSTCYAAAASRNLPGTQRYLLKMA